MDEPNSANLSHFFGDIFLPAMKRASNIGITTHVIADVDALASTVGLKNLILQLAPEKSVHTIIPQLNRLAQKIRQDIIPLESIETVWPEQLDVLFMVDCSDIHITELPFTANTDELKISIDQIFVIDHHIEPKLLHPKITHTLIMSNYSSAAEVITEFYKQSQIIPVLPIAKLLVLGIITDSGNFRYANNQTLETTEYLLSHDKVILRELIALLQLPIARPERIARIRAAMRIEELYYLNQYVVAISHVSAFEASSCKALLELGADVSFVIAYEKKTKQFRISSRASETILQETGLHLGKVMALVGDQYKGSGGGHNGAAGCYGTLDSAEFMQEIIPPLLAALRKVFQESVGNVQKGNSEKKPEMSIE